MHSTKNVINGIRRRRGESGQGNYAEVAVAGFVRDQA